jgi:hypothetical protein
MIPLTDREQRILDHEHHHYKHAGAKDTAVAHQFGNITHYYQDLNDLLDRQEALAYAPHTVQRLRGRRRARR